MVDVVRSCRHGREIEGQGCRALDPQDFRSAFLDVAGGSHRVLGVVTTRTRAAAASASDTNPCACSFYTPFGGVRQVMANSLQFFFQPRF